MQQIEFMKNPAYKENIKYQIEMEREKQTRLKNRTNQLEKQIKTLVEDSVGLLKSRMGEIGLDTNNTKQQDFLAKAKEIVGKHKELQNTKNKLQQEVMNLEEENNNLSALHLKILAEKNSQDYQDFELASKASHDLVLREINNTFNQRKNLKNKIATLEAELQVMEKANDDKKAQAPPVDKESPQKPNSGIFVSSNIYKQNPNAPGAGKPRKSREHRTKSHEWPEIPDIGKIEEQNPELLAKKILATGRQIEAKFATTQMKNKDQHFPPKKQQVGSGPMMSMNQPKEGDTMSMPAPIISGKSQKANVPVAGMKQGPPSGGGQKKVHESHKVVNFEDRLKSIITQHLLQGNEPPPSTAKQNPPQQQQQQHPQSSISPKKSLPGSYTTQNWTTISPSGPQNILSIVTTPHQLPLATTISPTQISPIKSRHMGQQQDQHPDANYSAMMQKREHLQNLAKLGLHPSEINKMIIQQNSQIIYQQQQQQQYLQPRENPTMIFQRNVAEEKREFKTPDNVRYERQQQMDMGRSSVGSIENEYITSSNSNSGQKGGQQRSSSSLSQPDYTLTSPAKLALRRHLSLSQEKLAIPQQFATKTIGDFINSEIERSLEQRAAPERERERERERTLEISNQSIINAAINISTGNVRNEPGVIQERERDDDHGHYSGGPISLKTSTKPQFAPEHFMQIDPHPSRRPTMKLIQQQHKYQQGGSSSSSSSSYGQHHEASRKSAISPSSSDAMGGFYQKGMEHQKEPHLEGLAGNFITILILKFNLMTYFNIFSCLASTSAGLHEN